VSEIQPGFVVIASSKKYPKMDGKNNRKKAFTCYYSLKARPIEKNTEDYPDWAFKK